MNLHLRVLIVEGEPEEVVFLKDVLSEIEEGRGFRPWKGIDVLYAQTCEEAEALLATETVDVIVLNPDLPDRKGFPTFRRLQAIAPSIPMVVLLGQGEAVFGVRLVREGAQDFLIRPHIDCEILLHALRNAMERPKPAVASEASRLRDNLTGLPSVGCFALFAERDLNLARQLGCRWMILIAEPPSLESDSGACAQQRVDLRLVEAAEVLRQLASPADAVYRTGPAQFAITRFETSQETLETMAARVARSIPRDGVVFGKAIYEPEHPAGLESLMADAQEDLTLSASRRPPAPAAPASAARHENIVL
jgi:DNA-binding response OmpR family regulator